MGKKILLADDSITIQKVIELTFSDEDFEVVTVGNGRLAIEKVQDVRPDVVLCDIIMPEKDGYEVCDFVKKNPALSHIPVLLLTGAFEPFDQERAARVGCDGFLAKPFEPQALIAKVKDLLRQVEARRPAPPAPAPAAEPEPSPAATVWAAPSPVSSPAWEPPQTRPVWTAPAPVAPPVPEPSGGHFIPEDPFAEDASAGYTPPSGDTVRVPAFPEEPFDDTPEVEAEPYVLERAGREDDLMPMTAEEEHSFAEPMTWEPPPPPPEPPRTSATAERDLFLEEVFDEAAAAVEAAHASASAPPAAEPHAEPHVEPAVPEPMPAPEPEPLPARAEAVPDFAAVARDAGFAPAPEPEPVREEPELEPEPLPEPEPLAAAPVAVSPAPEPEPEPEPVPVPLYHAAEPEASRVEVMEPPPMPETVAAAPVAAEPAAAQPSAAEDLQLEEESFAEMGAAAPEPAAPAAVPSEAGAVSVPMDMVSQIAQRVVAQISEKVIREIAWEVIPDMAEALIKREIERLTAELHQR